MEDCQQPMMEAKALVKPELREGLVNRKQRLESQLNDLKLALDALDKNPEVAKLLELVGRASRY